MAKRRRISTSGGFPDPRPSPQLGKRVLMREGRGYQAKLERSKVPIPGETLTVPIWEDAAQLERWMGVNGAAVGPGRRARRSGWGHMRAGVRDATRRRPQPEPRPAHLPMAVELAGWACSRTTGSTAPRRFRAQMTYLARSMRPVSMEDVVAAADGRKGLPDRAVLVTFDDGHRSVLERGLPVLTELGIPGVAFVIAGLLDTDEPFWWSEVDRPGRCRGVPWPHLTAPPRERWSGR